MGFSHTPENLSRIAVFVAIGVQISWLSAALHKARRRAEADARLARAAERAARESEQRYRTLAANFPDGAVFLFDRDLRWLLADGKALAASGVSREQLEGKTLRDVLPPDVSGQIEPVYRAALAGEPAAAEVEQNGRVYFVHAVPLRDADGTVSAGLCITLDVTERVRVREALREARDELERRVRERTAELHYQKTLLEAQSEASLDGILVVSQAGHVAYANRRFVELWQLSDSPAGASLESISAAMRHRLPGGRDPLVEVSGPYPCPEGEAHEELRLTDGTVLECYSTTVRSDDGTSHGRVWFFHDVTPRKRAEAELDARLRQQAAGRRPGVPEGNGRGRPTKAAGGRIVGRAGRRCRGDVPDRGTAEVTAAPPTRDAYRARVVSQPYRPVPREHL